MVKFHRSIISLIFLILFSHSAISQERPGSFADLTEKLMPAVVNISTSKTVVKNANPFPFEFPPGSPFEDMFKEFGTPQKRKSSALGRYCKNWRLGYSNWKSIWIRWNSNSRYSFSEK